jgi:hypothetical protein
MSRHSDLCVAAKEAIDALHRDTSVSQAATRCDLRDLREHIDMLLEGLGGGGLHDYEDLEDEG